MKAILGLFLGLGVILSLLIIIPSVQNVMAAGDEPGEYLDRRVEIWGLFYRLMIVAFTVGTVVSGMIVWLVLRFRESNPKATPTEYEADGKW
jgi:heme/copper-type cytochrome/quinol oxidase subunit 2